MSSPPFDVDLSPDHAGPPPFIAEALPAPIDVSNRDQDDMALFESGGVAISVDARKQRPGHNISSTLGFFFPIVWFLYKKMYLQASIIVLFPILLSLLQMPNAILRGMGLLVSLFGAFGPRLHTAKGRRTIAEIRAAVPDDATARLTIGQAGGVSVAGAVLGVLVTISVLMIALVKR
jgi:hypothetical protein